MFISVSLKELKEILGGNCEISHMCLTVLVKQFLGKSNQLWGHLNSEGEVVLCIPSFTNVK